MERAASVTYNPVGSATSLNSGIPASVTTPPPVSYPPPPVTTTKSTYYPGKKQGMSGLEWLVLIIVILLVIAFIIWMVWFFGFRTIGLPPGANCVANSECQLGTYCSAVGTCTTGTPKKNGEHCLISTQCYYGSECDPNNNRCMPYYGADRRKSNNSSMNSANSANSANSNMNTSTNMY